MATDLENIATIRSNALAELAAGNIKPSYSLDGQAVSWGEYYRDLHARVDWAEAKMAASAPFELHSYGVT